MIADIFYPIFTLTITVTACFIQKKKNQNCLRVLHPHFHQGNALDPQFQLLLASPKTDAPIFFLYYPLKAFDMNCACPILSTTGFV